MKFCGIICEFNPLTNGHLYFINQAKELSGLNVLALMSGNFTQRGEMAVLNKFERAKQAINAGCFAVLELPTCYAVSPAENFAFGAIKALNEIGSVTHIAFGIETNNPNNLTKIAQFLSSPPQNYTASLQNKLKQGKNYHFSQIETLKEFFDEIIINDCFSGANNILAIEYLKAIIKLHANLSPIFIKRCDNGFNSQECIESFLGATTIRKKLKNKEDVSNFVPESELSTLLNATNQSDGFSNFMLYNLRTKTPKELQNYYDYSEGIEYLISKNAISQNNINNLIQQCISKRYRESRINRLILYPTLNLTKKLYNQISHKTSTIKLLAIKTTNKQNIKYLTCGRAKIIITNQDYKNANSPSLKLDLFASNIYYAFNQQPHNLDLITGTLFM